jgi:hypothetical protein
MNARETACAAPAPDDASAAFAHRTVDRGARPVGSSALTVPDFVGRSS